jgi:hypothetical protein
LEKRLKLLRKSALGRETNTASSCLDNKTFLP